MARLNQLIAVLEKGEVAFGSFLPSGMVDQAFEVGDSDLDFTIVDMEHSGFDFISLRDTLQWLLSRRRMLQAGSIVAGPTPLVRLPANAEERSSWMVKQTLDYGAFGIVTPHVRTADDVAHLVSSARYPQRFDSTRPEPVGHRGISPGWAMRYWGCDTYLDYIERADLWPLNPSGEILLMPLIEDVAGVRNIAQIVATPGIGAILVGDGDLSLSLGHPMERDHPDVRAARLRVLAACRSAGVACGDVANAQNLEERIADGFQLFMVPRDQLARAWSIAGRA